MRELFEIVVSKPWMSRLILYIKTCSLMLMVLTRNKTIQLQHSRNTHAGTYRKRLYRCHCAVLDRFPPSLFSLVLYPPVFSHGLSQPGLSPAVFPHQVFSQLGLLHPYFFLNGFSPLMSITPQPQVVFLRFLSRFFSNKILQLSWKLL